MKRPILAFLLTIMVLGSQFSEKTLYAQMSGPADTVRAENGADPKAQPKAQPEDQSEAQPEDQSEMFPFVISYDAPDNVSSMAHILSAPAGKDGFIRADENGNFVNDAGIIRFNATDGEGPQKFNTGGEVSLWVSSNRGASWKKVRQMTQNSPRNHCYPRRPIDRHEDFFAFWADGHGRKPSEADLYFSNIHGDVFKLPRKFPDGEETASPIPIP